MNIRSITAFADVSYPLGGAPISELWRAVSAVQEALSAAGFTVQTTRLATQPIPDILKQADTQKALALAEDLEALSAKKQFNYVALGPVRLDDPPRYVEVIPDILGGTASVFASIEVASRVEGLSLTRIRLAAEVIRRAALLREDGFANLRLAALANVGAWSPFFPAAYHGGGAHRIALATESADLAVNAVREATTLREARARLISAVEAQADRLETITRRALEGLGVLFQGIDFSLAPYPDDARSIGAALEKLGLPAFGGAGSIMAAAFLTDALDRARFTRTGFCGLMLPVLEDTFLARRAAEGVLQIPDLLVSSAVCGTGLDTIPLPGDIGQDRLAAVLTDMAALALRLDKPLTARLMPLPGKQPGDPVTFEFEYFASSRVMDVRGGALARLLAGDETVQFQPRSTGQP